MKNLRHLIFRSDADFLFLPDFTAFLLEIVLKFEFPAKSIIPQQETPGNYNLYFPIDKK